MEKLKINYNLRLSSVKLPLVNHYRHTHRHLSLPLHEYQINSFNDYFKMNRVHYIA